MEVIKSCSQCGACKRYRSTLGYSPTKVYYPCLIPPSQPSMKTLLERAWRAKRLSQAKKKAQAAPQPPQDELERAEQPVERKAVKMRPSTGIISGLLSRRRGKHVLMTVEIPKRDPFPPPLAPSG